jgi:hypothetical protein
MEAFDFRYMPISHAYYILDASNWLFASQQASPTFLHFVMEHLSHGYFSAHQEKGSLQPPLRTEPTSELEQLLVESVARAGNFPVKPATFPISRQVCSHFCSHVRIS